MILFDKVNFRLAVLSAGESALLATHCSGFCNPAQHSNPTLRVAHAAPTAHHPGGLRSARKHGAGGPRPRDGLHWGDTPPPRLLSHYSPPPSHPSEVS